MTYLGSVSGGGGGTPVLDVETEIDPLHLYRPINDAQWTTLVSGDVSVLKDNGRGAAVDLGQTTANLRPVQGTDGLGNEFMEHTQTSPNEQFVDGGVVADWKFLNYMPSGGGATVAVTLSVDDLNIDSLVLETSISNNGFFLRVNGDQGTGFSVDTGATRSVELLSGGPLSATAGLIGPTGIYTVVARYRDVNDAVSGDPENRIGAELSLNSQVMIVNQPRPEVFNDVNPEHILTVGASPTATDVGLLGKIYEIALDDRYWSDELVRRYHARGVSEFGASNMVLTT